MSTNQFAVIGHPLAHTMSPFIHTHLFALSGYHGACSTDGATGTGNKYGARDIAPEALADVISELRLLSGFNITIPHKQAIIPYLETLDAKAAFFHSVNTVKNENGNLIGYTTDGAGFCRALEGAGVSLSGHTVVLGAGGAARVLAFEAALSGGRVTVAARAHSLDAAKLLCKDLNEKVPGANACACLMDQIEGPVDLLANATPVGMYPRIGECPVTEEVIRQCACVFDAVYNPGETGLLKLARRCGVKTVGGMSMLVWQAAEAHKIWYGADFSNEDIDRLCAQAEFEMKKQFGNVILCGFMGSGKTTVGRLLAQKTGRRFIDLDQWIEQSVGMTVSEIFDQRGETAFREMERDAAAELSEVSGLVIAVGGGTLKNPENTAVLKRNGLILFLDASLEVIGTRLKGDETRPLLAVPNRTERMSQLYLQRTPIYRAAADTVIPADGEADRVAQDIFEMLRPAVRQQ